MQAVVTAGPEILNHLPRAELQRLADSACDAPERALLTFATRTRWLGGLASRSCIDGLEAGGQRVDRRHAIDADEPKVLLGGDAAASPAELFFSAIGACLTAVYAVHATLSGIELRSLEVELRGTLDLRGVLGLAEIAPGFPELELRVFIDADTSPEQIRVLHARVLATAPNLYHLTAAIPARAQLVLSD